MASSKPREHVERCIALLREHRMAKLVYELLLKEGIQISEPSIRGIALAEGIELDRKGEGAGRPKGAKDSRPRETRSEKKEHILTMIRDGIPEDQIAEFWDVSPAHVYQLRKDAGIPSRRERNKINLH